MIDFIKNNFSSDIPTIEAAIIRTQDLRFQKIFTEDDGLGGNIRLSVEQSPAGDITAVKGVYKSLQFSTWKPFYAQKDQNSQKLVLENAKTGYKKTNNCRQCHGPTQFNLIQKDKSL